MSRAILAAIVLCLCVVQSEANAIDAELSRVAARCVGFQRISTVRPHAVVAGTHRASLHRYGLAVDFRVNDYRCAYSVLANWHHGLSMDAWRVRHIHISDGSSIGRNEGRFYHGGVRAYASRHRGQHHRRYARA
jgi:hypothetical protein